MPQPDSHEQISQILIKIDGSNAPSALMDDLVNIRVDQQVFLPTMFTITVRNADMEWLEEQTLREGKEIEIISLEERRQIKLCKGKIAALEGRLREQEPLLTVRGYDKSHKLHRNKRTRVFKQIKDSDLASQIGRDAGLQTAVESTTVVFDYLLQNNESDFELLRRRADRIGYELFIRDETLHFRKPKPDEGEVVSLEWGVDLKYFRPRLTTVEQVGEVEVRGWDQKNKEVIIGHSSQGQAGVRIGEQQRGGDIASQTWGQSKLTLVDQPVVSQQEAEDLAQAHLDALAGSFVQGEAEVFGRGSLQAGKVVELTGLGKRFSGHYYITAALHEYDKHKGHMVKLSLCRRRTQTLREILAVRSPRPLGQGVVVGIVTSNRDPDNYGRIKVKFPWLGEDIESHWIRMATPMAGKDRGFYFLPEVNDEVLLGFEHGDMQYPFVLGALWNGEDIPVKPNSDVVGTSGTVDQRIIKTRAGHVITLDDSDRSPGISIVDKTGNNKIVIESTPNDMTIEVQGNMNIKAQGKISLEAATIEIKAQGPIKMQGNMIEIDGGPMVNIKGAMIKLN